MFVLRNVEGVIVGIFANLQPGVAEEYLAENDQEIMEFYASIRKSEL